jgi:hypothetical protein
MESCLTEVEEIQNDGPPATGVEGCLHSLSWSLESDAPKPMFTFLIWKLERWKV